MPSQLPIEYIDFTLKRAKMYADSGRPHTARRSIREALNSHKDTSKMLRNSRIIDILFMIAIYGGRYNPFVLQAIACNDERGFPLVA